ncbi:MAG TPA: OmpA family protein [Anaeromyxobacter sp.]
MSARGLVVAAVLLVAACSHAAKVVQAETPQAAEPAAVAPQAPAASSAKACSSDDQCSASELCVSATCVAITPGLAECRPSAHFDFDRADLHPGDEATLQRASRCLMALQKETALVEGNCDDRGTVQYNIALGFRRAHAVAKYVEDLGVPTARMSEVSYGKELPVCTASTESCWAMNRRADLAPGARPRDVAARIRAGERRERTVTASPDTQGSKEPAAHPANPAP